MREISRRELLGVNGSDKAASNEDKVPDGSIENSKTGEKTFSKRQFLGFLGALGTVAASQGLTADEAQAAPPVLNRKTDMDSYKETAIENTFMMAASTITGAVLNELKIEHGNKSFDQKTMIRVLREKPIETFITVGALGPLIEEAIFRALPAGFISGTDRSSRWDIGIPSSVVFALIHNIQKSPASGELELNTKSVPLEHFMIGLFYWYLMRERGFNHAVFAHSMHNTVALGVAKLLLEAYPGAKNDQE